MAPCSYLHKLRREAIDTPASPSWIHRPPQVYLTQLGNYEAREASISKRGRPAYRYPDGKVSWDGKVNLDGEVYSVLSG